MYIEPCCIDNQLPRLLRQSDGHAAMFQTSGDVTLEHMIKALMPMVGDRPRVLTLALPVVDDDVIALLQRYMRLEWVAHLNLILPAPAEAESQSQAQLLSQLERICRPCGRCHHPWPAGVHRRPCHRRRSGPVRVVRPQGPASLLRPLRPHQHPRHPLPHRPRYRPDKGPPGRSFCRGAANGRRTRGRG